jgi:ribulose-5-phosphate 4-epimerase/fuculose-1-phosphate aldolase
MYWNTFYENVKCFPKLYEFIEWNKNIGIKILILTDYETEYQIEKLSKCNLLNLVDHIVTSEEVGIEKPHCNMFNYAMKIMDLYCDDLIMIGDSWEKDIIGATQCNIKSYWFTDYDSDTTFNDYEKLLTKFKSMYDDLNTLRHLSRYVGERFDLVQGGGGNTSCKNDNIMFIKASGKMLSDMTLNSGYSTIDNKRLIHDICNNTVKDIMTYNYFGKTRSSIETFMHSILHKYVLHLHPIQINKVLILKDAKMIVNEICSESLFLPYITPGLAICTQLLDKWKDEKIIFLQNHGIIITSNNISELYILLENTIEKFEKYLNIDYSSYKYVNTISKYIDPSYKYITWLCEDEIIKKYIHNVEILNDKITFPDALIYCGLKIMKYIDISSNIIPAIVLYKDNIYIIGTTLNKCKEIQDVFKAKLLISDIDEEKTYLSDDEICFLNNWDAEKYRQMLI